jgi:hypothetical protein
MLPTWPRGLKASPARQRGPERQARRSSVLRSAPSWRPDAVERSTATASIVIFWVTQCLAQRDLVAKSNITIAEAGDLMSVRLRPTRRGLSEAADAAGAHTVFVRNLPCEAQADHLRRMCVANGEARR